MEKENKNIPVTYRAGTCKVVIWENKSKVKDVEVTNYNITLERIYKDKEDSWQSTNSFDYSHLTTLIRLLNRVIDDKFPIELNKK